ncbi:MAG: transglutaminase domain-containing protein [Roseinatronobacter sp.]
MLYDIRLTMDYRYTAASDQVRNILRLLPVDGPEQTVLRRVLKISPAPDLRRDGVDFFGNLTTTIAWHRPISEVTYSLHAQARRHPVRGGFPIGFDQLEQAMDDTALDARSPWHFCGPSARIGLIPEIADFARSVADPKATLTDVVEAIGRAIHRHMTFDADATDVSTPPEQAFKAQRGVCQDFAQIMVAALRALGVPAGYVSGFLRTLPPPGKPRLEGVDAMHAWVMAWAGPGQGWVEYDPTNRQWAGVDYVTVARGRDYADAAPLRGAIRTSGGQETGHRVDVVPIPQVAR